MSDRFKGSRRGGLSQALRYSSDRELAGLNAQIVERQERIAQLQFEVSDTQADLARFQQEYQNRVGTLETQLQDLEDELTRARHSAARRAQWGDRVYEEDAPVDVEEQFKKTWTSTGEPKKTPPEKKELDERSKEELKRYFRELAKRYHPDLVTDAAEKKRREKIMAEVNDAYASQDLAALREISQRPEQPAEAAEKSREQMIVELQAEIVRLDGVITGLERSLQQLINSRFVKLMLDVSIAAKSGQDLLGEMAADLRVEIARVEVELAALRR